MEVVKRTFGYHEASPVMILAPARSDNRKRFIIKMDDLWKYSDTHNELFESFMANKVLQICQLFDIKVPKGEHAFVQLMSSISAEIMDGIDDLVKMAPYRDGHDDPESVINKIPDMPNMTVGMMN